METKLLYVVPNSRRFCVKSAKLFRNGKKYGSFGKKCTNPILTSRNEKMFGILSAKLFRNGKKHGSFGKKCTNPILTSRNEKMFGIMSAKLVLFFLNYYWFCINNTLPL